MYGEWFSCTESVAYPFLVVSQKEAEKQFTQDFAPIKTLNTARRAQKCVSYGGWR